MMNMEKLLAMKRALSKVNKAVLVANTGLRYCEADGCDNIIGSEEKYCVQEHRHMRHRLGEIEDFRATYQDIESDIFENKINDIVRKHQEWRENVIKNAISGGYNGVDFIPKLDDNLGWKLSQWSLEEDVEMWDELPESNERRIRYDFRYYDQEAMREAIDEDRLLEYLTGQEG